MISLIKAIALLIVDAYLILTGKDIDTGTDTVYYKAIRRD